MSAIFGNLSNEGIEESQDRLGGFAVRESDAYLGTIKAAYVGQSANSKARSVTVIAVLKETETHLGGEYRETFWVTNRDDKNFYVDTKDGNKKKPLAGFTIVDDLCQVTIGKGLADVVTEDKVINVYDPDQKKELPKSVPMIVEMIDTVATFGILKKLKNKQAKDANGTYQDTPDSRDENETDKIFHHPSNLTMAEARNKKNATFYGAWVEKNRGKTRDQRTIKDGVGNGQSGRTGRPNGAPPKAGDTGAKTSSLFANAN